ncbi:tyrosine-protein phosphatase [Parasulfitobacter algicola]|uniref:Tyrosine-protein phosphatase n=1 Tax=Parasulfitobacter algicola TaxID=2614809 RepID=A0ABX2ISG6_9RHOB|nr:tyrosine-protein phosphatase [Sulfitobacter algicola]NSX54956.1 tyrosine-protein phosphatase [Sulfitobacter algicola]
MMFQAVTNKLNKFERKLRRAFGDDISTPLKRAEAIAHYQLMDHAFFRFLWTNFDKVADGVFRSNQPTDWRWKAYKKMGIKAVLNLRGPDNYSPYLFEKETLDDLGILLVDAKIYARKPPKKDELLHLINCLKTMPKPFLLHCKSGADRAGLASALYLLIVEGEPLEVARQQLSWRYLHLKFTKTGIVDHILDVFEEQTKDTGMDFETWVHQHYSRDAMKESFAAEKRAWF